MTTRRGPGSGGVTWPTIGQLWAFLGVALPALAALLVPMPAVDLAYHLRAGASILVGEGIPATDTWTFTVAGAAWLDQQWGAQALLAGVFQLAGWTGLAVLRAGLVAVTFGLVQATLRSMGCANRPAALLALGGFVLAAPALALRPQLFAILLFAASLAILAGRARHPRRLWLLPLIAVAWANLHGSFPIILVVMTLGWLDELARVLAAPPQPARTGVQPPRRSARTAAALRGSTGIALIGAVAAVGTLVNPFGIDAWRYVERLASNPSVASAVSEWRPPSPIDPAGAIFYVSLLIAIIVIALRVRSDGNRLSVSTLAPVTALLAFGTLGVVTGRGLAWWALIMPISTAALAHDGNLTRLLPKVLAPVGALFTGPKSPRPERRSPLNTVVGVALIAVGVMLLPLWRQVGPAGVPNGTLTHAPQGIAARLNEYARTRNVNAWVPQTWGSWFELAAPDARIAVDSRIELFPAAVWADAHQVAEANGEWLSIFDRYGVTVVVVAAGQDPEIEAQLGASPTWVRSYQDVDGSIWTLADEIIGL